MIAFKVVIIANAPYSQSCFLSAAHVSIAAIVKKMIATLRYHSGDELVRCGSCSCCSTKISKTFLTTKDTKDHEGRILPGVFIYPITKLPNHSLTNFI